MILRRPLALPVGLALALFLSLPPGAARADLAGEVDAFLSGSFPDDQPGAAVIVTRDGETLYRGAHGTADLELGVPLEPDMVFRLGSITKQFTGAAILLLVEDGKIALDDPITKFLPDYPVHGHEITVAHLLAHTSGIRSYTDMPGWMTGKIREDLDLDELISGFASEPMDFAPGEEFRYNNSGYVLLGAIIEKASGQTYEEFVEKRIFGPLGMEHSDFDHHERVIPRRARGYSGAPEERTNAAFLDMDQPHAAGSLLSTVDDLARWNEALGSDRILSPESRQRMVTPFSLNDGSSTDYAFGLGIGELRGRKMISHGGGIFGFSTFALRLPEEDVFVAVLANADSPMVSPGYAARKIAAMAIGDPFPEREQIRLDPEVLRRYEGVYRIDDATTRTVTLVDGVLFTQRTDGPKLPIRPFSETGFFYDGSFTHLDFVLDETGDVSHMLMFHDGAKEPERADLTDEPLPEGPTAVAMDPARFDDFVGDYELQPGFVLSIFREGDQLMSRATGQPAIEIFPKSQTVFFARVVDAELEFERDADGTVVALVLRQAGAEMRAPRRR